MATNDVFRLSDLADFDLMLILLIFSQQKSCKLI